MMGSKYSDAVRDKVKALAASGTMTGAQISKAVNVPKATVYEWIQKAREGDEDFQAELAQKRRKRLDACFKIYDNALRATESQMKTALRDRKAIEQGLQVIAKAARDGVLTLDEDDAKKLKSIVQGHTDIPLRDLTDTLKKMEEQARALTAEEAESGEIQISFGDSEDLAG